MASESARSEVVSDRFWHVKSWKLWTLPLRVIVFVLSVELAAVFLTVAVFDVFPVTRRDLLYFGVLVALGLVAAEATRHVEQMRRRFSDTPHVNMSSVWTVAAALLLAPGVAAAITIVLYSHLWLRSWQRVNGMNIYRVAFSACSVILSCYVAAALLHVLPGAHTLNLGSLVGLVSVVTVIIVYWVVNSGLVAAVIALSQGERSLLRLMGSWRENSLEYATLCVGVLVALLITSRPLALVLVMLPLYVLTRSVLVRQLEHAATTDQKTGLLNATTWQSLAKREISHAKQHDKSVGILMVDVDHFKIVNDSYGHLVGDEALRAIVDAMRSTLRADDLCGRFGGEEFLVLLPDVDTQAAVAVADRICSTVREIRLADPAGELAGLRLSVSIGVAVFPHAGRDLEEVLLAADNVLFAAKDAGRDRVHAVHSS